MKGITVNLTPAEASGEAYWRKRCDVVEAELARLRAVNAELVEAIRSLRPVIEKIQGLSEAVDAALSRAEQAKPETCVWTVSENGVWIRPGCTGAQMLKGHMFIRPETCSYCKKKLIIEQAGKAEGSEK